MLKIASIVAITAVSILIPLTITYAQNTDSGTSSTFLSIEPENNDVGPVAVVDEYQRAYDKLKDWTIYDKTSTSDELKESLKNIHGYGLGGPGEHQALILTVMMDSEKDAELFVNDDPETVKKYLDRYQPLFPGLTIEIWPIIDEVTVTWHSGTAQNIQVCNSQTDDCVPQKAGMEVQNVLPNNTSAAPSTITLGVTTEDG